MRVDIIIRGMHLSDVGPVQCQKPRLHCDSVSIESIMVDSHLTCRRFTNDFSPLVSEAVFPSE